MLGPIRNSCPVTEMTPYCTEYGNMKNAKTNFYQGVLLAMPFRPPVQTKGSARMTFNKGQESRNFVFFLIH